MAGLYYITISSNKKINIPFVPPRKISEELEDKYAIINKIFGNNVNPKYEKICNILIDAISYSEPAYWEEVADLLILSDLPSSVSSKWATHCVNVARAIERRPHTKIKTILPLVDPVVLKFRKLLRGF